LNRRTRYFFIALFSMMFVVGLWQLEIADNFLLNDWGDYNVFFTLIEVSNIWAVRDFYMIVMIVAFIGVVFIGDYR